MQKRSCFYENKVEYFGKTQSIVELGGGGQWEKIG